LEELPAAEDMRGMTVRDRHGLIAGRVVDLYVDGESGAIRYMGVAVGRRVRGQALVPLDEAVATTDPLDVELQVPYTRAEVRAAPVCPEDGAPTVAIEIAVWRHFSQAGARRDTPEPATGPDVLGDPQSVRTVRWGT
jgi:hypothetical protein